MTREDAIRMAREAGFNWPEVATTTIEQRLERFAALVAAAERARMCEQFHLDEGIVHEAATKDAPHK